jgi:hypothetical protein
MPDQTGFARGTLSPIVYFKRGTDGYCILAPIERDKGTEVARMLYERRYKLDWSWEEARSLDEAQDLERKLCEQAMRERQHMIDVDSSVRENVRRQTGQALYQRMVSDATNPFERDFIKCWLQLRDEEKRNKYKQRLREHNDYIFALQMDSGTKVDDRMKAEPGDIWRPEADQ